MQHVNYCLLLTLLHGPTLFKCCLGLNTTDIQQNIAYPNGFTALENENTENLKSDITNNGLNHLQIKGTSNHVLRLKMPDNRLKTDEHDSRLKRTQQTVTDPISRNPIDSGYGSRLSAASKLARDRVLQLHVYGNWGPGKRSRSALSLVKDGRDPNANK